MNVRGAAVQSGLAALGLVVAYTTWQREPERAPGEVTVVEVNKGDVQKIRLDTGDGKWVELERKKDARDEDPRVWLKISADAQKKTPQREMAGNEGAERLWDKFAPLRATRALGALKPEKLKELGLDAPKKKLELTARSVKHTFAVGSSPMGVSDPYAKDEQDGRVYVLGGGVIADLESASTRLVDRTLHTFKPADFDGITVTGAGKTHAFGAPQADNQFAAKLIEPKTGKPAEVAKNWHDKVWRSMVTDVLGKGETPEHGTPEVGCKIEYTWHGKSKGFIEIGRLTPAAPPVSSSPAAPPPVVSEAWARTEHTSGWVKLPSNADDLLRDCSKVAGAE
jgi:hypothetical protein